MGELLKGRRVRMDGKDTGQMGRPRGIFLSFYGHGKQRKKRRRENSFRSAVGTVKQI